MAFEKIDLSNQQNMGRKRQNRIKLPKSAAIIVGAIALGILGLGLVVVSPAKKTLDSAKVTEVQARRAFDAIKNQNVELASTELAKTKVELAKTKKNLEAISYLRFVPGVNFYYGDADHLLKASSHGIAAAEIFVDSVKPYADLLGLKGQGSFVGGSAEKRIETAVLTMGKITPRIDDILDELVKAQKEIDKVSPARYPSFIVGSKVHKQIQDMRTLADEGVRFVDEARPLIKVLPSILGDPKEKRYLVLFQNDNELRPTGGFLTAYAIFRLNKGVIHIDRSDNIYNLDNAIANKPKAPEPILKYLPKVSTFNLRDSNLSADFIESMTAFNSLYNKASGNIDVDGIIAIDTNVLISTIKILDDQVTAGGVSFNTKIDKRCECPQVIYELERIVSTPKSIDIRVTSLESVQAARKDILGVLLYAIMEKALKSSPKKYWGPLFQAFIKDMNEKHALFYLYDKDAQSGIEALNAAGRIKPFEGDYLHINEANFGGQKSNLFIKQEVSEEIKVAGDGTIEKTVTITYKNPFPPSDCNLERGGLCLNATLRDWLRVFVPKGSQLVSAKGSEVKVISSEDLGKTVFEGFLTVKPMGAATFTITYKLPFKVKNGKLPHLIQKQPGTDGIEYTIKVNGRQVKKFPLDTDKTLTLDL